MGSKTNQGLEASCLGQQLSHLLTDSLEIHLTKPVNALKYIKQIEVSQMLHFKSLLFYFFHFT